MKVSAFLFALLFVMILIAYASGGEIAHRYGDKFFQGGHEIYIANSTSGMIDNNPVRVINMGDMSIPTYNVIDILPENNTIIIYHGIYGFLGGVQYIGISSQSERYIVGENFSYLGLNFTYLGQLHSIFIYGLSAYSWGMPTYQIMFVRVGLTMMGIPQFQSAYFTFKDRTYGLHIENIGGTTYIQVISFLIKEYSTKSILLMIMMGVVIYGIGFAILRRRAYMT